ncbi:Clavaminate synthase-like protein [Nadsonia fulvescens var. elongata DSM 6958]|uniref:Clavaminate synthase-like protein n=1 Tax=Nadsonia fulvescens var. elongata DSM 6958 TaxID=857566 RepID=A0A1E3PHZ8_9ASCO|nr:Clavaminate synthase-like protein [Nadsonia fulvescens var. elongata DSM 6958]
MREPEINTPVIVSLKDLQAGLVDNLLPEAFGPDSLGIIIVKDLPENFINLRQTVLSSASNLAALPTEKLRQMEDDESSWLVGWSCGKEKLAFGKPDNLKGSFYINCSFHKDPSLEGPPEDEITGFEDFKSYTKPNIWPEESCLPKFQANTKELCNLIIDVAKIVAQACDRYVGNKIKGYPEGYLNHVVTSSTTTKARLLHYFPPVPSIDGEESGEWCGEHLDHSCLTGLTSAMLVDEESESFKSGKIEELVSNPDASSGLFIKNRLGNILKISFPKNCLAFQTGGALQAATFGEFKAVPHFVKASNTPNISRNTLAVFCQPSLHEIVGNEGNFATYTRKIINQNH